MWGHTPYVCYGQKSHQVCLFLHGQSGNKEEGERFAQIANPKGWQVVAIDLPQHGQRQGGAEPFLPWVVVPELEQVWQELQGRWSRIALRANSIGAWLSMLALAGKPVDTCLYGERDNLVPQPVAERFAQAEGADLTVCPGGEHWFHTPEQVDVMGQWEARCLP